MYQNHKNLKIAFYFQSILERILVLYLRFLGALKLSFQAIACSCAIRVKITFIYLGVPLMIPHSCNLHRAKSIVHNCCNNQCLAKQCLCCQIQLKEKRKKEHQYKCDINDTIYTFLQYKKSQIFVGIVSCMEKGPSTKSGQSLRISLSLSLSLSYSFST